MKRKLTKIKGREREGTRIRQPKENELNYNIICTNAIKTNQSCSSEKKEVRIGSSNRKKEKDKTNNKPFFFKCVIHIKM